MGSEKAIRWALFILYNGLLLAGSFFLLPFLIYSVTSTGKRRHTFRQRMGWCRYAWQTAAAGHGDARCIWVHALSVGEVQAAQPMVMRLRTLHPNVRICFSASTLTGFQTAEQLFGRQVRIELAYFPYDWIWAVRNVVSKIKPSMVILTETDIWPNFLVEMHRRRVPVCLVNLRLSDSSWRCYRRFWWLGRHIFSGFAKITVQDQRDYKRLTRLGLPVDKVAITGNLKFDSPVPASAKGTKDQWKRDLGIAPGKSILMAGSTHEGEEEVLLGVLRSLANLNVAPLLILAPRDPLRSKEIVNLSSAQGLPGTLLSSLVKEKPNTGCPPVVVVVDSIGILKTLYSLADIVFVGGSLAPHGGHNPLEPAAWGKPVLFGPDMRDFPLISRLLVEARAAVQVTDADDLRNTVERLLSDPQKAKEMGRRALRIFHSHQGAVDKTLAFLGLLG